MANNMVALLTLPKSDENSETPYPHLLILTIPDIFSQKEGDTSTNSEFYLYEIPSSLHLIDLQKAKFIACKNTLVCLYGKDIIYWEVNTVYSEEKEDPDLLVNYGHLKCSQRVMNFSSSSVQKVINVVFPNSSQKDLSTESINISAEIEDLGQETEPKLVEKLFRRYLVTHYKPIFDVYVYEEEESEVEVELEEEKDYGRLFRALEGVLKKRKERVLERVNEFSREVKRLSHAFGSLESVLSFPQSHLKRQSKITKTGKALGKLFLQRLSHFSRKISKFSRGLRLLYRLTRYKQHQNVLKHWYKWKISISTPKYESIEQPSEISTVIGETKRQILNSHHSNPSKPSLNSHSLISQISQLSQNSKIPKSPDDSQILKNSKKKQQRLRKYFSKKR